MRGKGFLLIRGQDLSKSMSSYLSERVEQKPNIEILSYTEIRKMIGGKHLESVEVENTQTGECRTIDTVSFFSVIGVKPCTDWLPPEIERDARGFVKTGTAVANSRAWQNSDRRPGSLETSRPGIFAGGDVRAGSVKRCAAAVVEGGMAVEGVHDFLGTYA